MVPTALVSVLVVSKRPQPLQVLLVVVVVWLVVVVHEEVEEAASSEQMVDERLVVLGEAPLVVEASGQGVVPLSL